MVTKRLVDLQALGYDVQIEWLNEEKTTCKIVESQPNIDWGEEQLAMLNNYFKI